MIIPFPLDDLPSLKLRGLFACSDIMAEKGINVEGPGHRGAVQQVRDQLVDHWKVVVHVALCIPRAFPKAQGKDLIGFGIGNENDPIQEATLAFQDRQDFVPNGFGKLPCFSFLSADGDDSTKHDVLLSYGSSPPKNQGYARRAQGSNVCHGVPWPCAIDIFRLGASLGKLIEYIEKLEREMARIEAADRAYFDGRKPTLWQEKLHEKRQERLEEIKIELAVRLRRPAG